MDDSDDFGDIGGGDYSDEEDMPLETPTDIGQSPVLRASLEESKDPGDGSRAFIPAFVNVDEDASVHQMNLNELSGDEDTAREDDSVPYYALSPNEEYNNADLAALPRSDPFQILRNQDKLHEDKVPKGPCGYCLKLGR